MILWILSEFRIGERIGLVVRIGIPRALLYYYYYPFWKTLFEELGCTVVVSDETNSKIISEGSKITVSELCVPIKIFNGHVLNLLEKQVDLIFIPHFYQMRKEWYCPKFLGIREMVLSSAPQAHDRLLVLDYVTKTDRLGVLDVHMPLCERLGVTKAQLKAALKKADAAQAECRRLCAGGYTMTEAFDVLSGKDVKPYGGDYELTIGLLGYVYNIYDDSVGMRAIQRLREMGARVITFDMLDERLLERHKNRIKEPYWVYARKIYNACGYLLQQPELDGVIHLTAFGCGPDSVIGKMMEIDCEAAGRPFMTLRVDEHTGDNHAQTRLEAFTDMIKMRKRRRAADLQAERKIGI